MKLNPDSNAKTLALIPCYKEAGHISAVVTAALAEGVDVVVVDDGSPDETAQQARAAGATVLQHQVNQGKGAAMATGLRYAQEHSYDAVILMDGDGQHLPSEISHFLVARKETGADVILGTRMGDTKTMPFIRFCTNKFMSWLLSLKAKRQITDSQCGYRMLAVKTIPTVLSGVSQGFAADSEMLLILSREGFSFHEVPVSTVYGNEKSKIHPVRDTIRFFRMLSRY